MEFGCPPGFFSEGLQSMCCLEFDFCEMGGLVQSWNTWYPADLQDLFVPYKLVGNCKANDLSA